MEISTFISAPFLSISFSRSRFSLTRLNKNWLWERVHGKKTKNPFSLNFRSKGCYLINRLTLVCDVKLVLDNGNQIPKTALIAPANNFLNTLFSSSQLYLNTTAVNSSVEFHHIKSGLINLLTSTASQASLLRNAGYVFQSGEGVNSHESASFVVRRGLFTDKDGNYLTEARTFMGPVFTGTIQILRNQGTGWVG